MSGARVDPAAALPAVEPWRPRPASDQRVEDLSLDEVVGQALGTASMCWANVAGAGEFDSVRARWVLDGLMAYLNRVIDGVIAGTTAAVRPAAGGAGVDAAEAGGCGTVAG